MDLENSRCLSTLIIVLTIILDNNRSSTTTQQKHYLPLLLEHLMLFDQKLSINQLIPGIWYSRKAPVAAVLISLRRSPLLVSQVLLPKDGRVCILSVVSHSRYVQVYNWSFHLVDHIL